MKTLGAVLLMGFFVSCPVSQLSAKTVYVDAVAGSDANDGLTVDAPFFTLQAAVDAAVEGDVVLAAPGDYGQGGRAAGGIALTLNRVVINKAIRVRGAQGPAVTRILGQTGVSPVRCVWLGTNATLSGFSLIGGGTPTSGGLPADRMGAGVQCQSGAVVTNCVFSGNVTASSGFGRGGGAAFGSFFDCAFTNNRAAYGGGVFSGACVRCSFDNNQVSQAGGGAYQADLDTCELRGNVVTVGGGGGANGSSLRNCTLLFNRTQDGSGGGAASSSLVDCLVASNSAASYGAAGGGGVTRSALSRCRLIGNTADGYGGGSNMSSLTNCVLWGNVANKDGGGDIYSLLVNCTIVSNRAAVKGGGTCQSAVTNSVVYYNSAPTAPNYFADQYGGTLGYCSTFPLPDGAGNSTSDPLLGDPANPNSLRPGAASPCLDAGSTNGVDIGALDLDGRTRVLGAGVDIGAYEYAANLSLTASFPAHSGLFQECAATMTITAELSSPAYEELTVPYTGEGTASPGDDFTIAESAFVFPAGSRTASIHVTILDDAVPEGLEYAHIQLTETNGVTPVHPSFYRLNIAASDGAPEVLSLTVNDGQFVTANRLISLSSTCTNDPTECIVSESELFDDGASWQTYADAVTYALSEAYGTKWVYFKVRRSFEGYGWVESQTCLATIVYGLPLEDALDVEVPVETSGYPPWYGQTDETSDELDAARCDGLFGAGEAAFSLQTTIAGTVSFYWSTHLYMGDAGANALTLLIDGVPAAAISNETYWTEQSVEVGEGTHTLEWRYSQVDGEVYGYGLVDQVRLPVPIPTHYVRPDSPSPESPYLTWDTAANTIQAAVDAASPGDVVLVTNGVYDTGARTAAEGALPNRVVVTGAITVRSVNGPQATVIRGEGLLGSSEAVRCAYLANGAVLSGFTLTDGATRDEQNALSWNDQVGGGAYCETEAVIDRCILTNNAASSGGGGVYGGTLSACVLVDNQSVLSNGGGAAESSLENCLLAGNRANQGGAAAWSFLYHCTVVGNSAEQGGGTAWGGAFNSIVYYNSALSNPNYQGGWNYTYSCTFPLPYGEGNVSAEPGFADTNNWADLRLTQHSLCINAGSTNNAVQRVDLDGNPRVAGVFTDMGAYEWQGTVLPAISLTAEQTVLSEDAATWALTVTASEALTGDTAFALSYGGTAARGADYADAPDTVVISNGQSGASFTLSVTDDAVPEHAETVVVALATDPAFRYGSQQQTLRLLDNDGMPEITRFYLNQGSGGTSTNLITDFDIAVTNEPTDYVISEDPAFAGVAWAVHNEEDPFVFTLSEGYGEKTVWFKVRKADGAGGYLESLPVSDSIIYGPTLPVALDAPEQAVATGSDYSSAATWFGVPDPAAHNGAWARSAPPLPDSEWINSWMGTSFTLDSPMLFRFDYAKVGSGGMDLQIDDTYYYSPDFIPQVPGVHTFEQELAPGFHTVRWSAYTGSEDGGAPGYSVVDNVSLTVPPPRVWFSVPEQTVAESNGTVSVTVVLEEPLPDDLTVSYTAVDGTAHAGADFALSGMNEVIIPAGATNASFAVTLLDDDDPEHGETFALALLPGSGYRPGESASQTIIILANDGLIDFFNVRLDHGAPETTNRLVLVEGEASEQPAEAIASEDPDFTGSDWIPLSANDTFFMLSEGYGLKTVYVKVRIPKAGGGWEESNVLSASIRLVGCTLSDALDTGLYADSPTFDRWFGQRAVTFDGSDAASSPTNLPDYSDADLSVTIQGPAKVSFRWRAMGSIVTHSSYSFYSYCQFLDNESSVAFCGNLLSFDRVVYRVPAGTHTLTWRYHKGYYYYTAPADRAFVDQLTVRPDWPEAAFANTSVSAQEDTGTVWLTLNLDRPETHDLEIPYTLAGTAAEGADYTIVPAGSVTIPAGETSAALALTVADDALPEKSEAVIVTLQSGDGVLAGDPAVTTVTIAPNDGAPQITSFGPIGGAHSESRTVAFAIDSSHEPTELRVSEDPSFEGAAWQPYAGTFTFELSESYGHKTVWVVVRKPVAGGGFVESDPAQTELALLPSLAFALNVSSLAVTSDSVSPWFGQVEVSRDGAAAQSGPISHYGSTSCMLTLNGSGTVGFYWKVSSEGGYDYLSLIEDGAYVSGISGSVDWTYVTRTFASQGTHTLEWRYTKDGSVNTGGDCGWVDQVSLDGWVFLPVATPQFAPPDGTLFNETLDVTLTCATPGATIRYTLDGSDPATDSAVYAGPITLAAMATVKAKAFKPGYPDSEIAQATYVRSNATPQFSPPGGTVFTNSLEVTITSAVATVSIRYTLDKSEPTASSALYAGPLTLTDTATIKAQAFEGETPASATSSATYTLQEADAPTFAPESGLLFDVTCAVTLACLNPGASIRYTLDGSAPTEASALYESALTCSNAMTVIRARAYKTGMAPSAISQAAYFRRGSVLVWGYNGNGECNVPADLTNAAAVAAGGNHVAALRADGTVTAWGYNGYSQCSVPSGLSDVIEVAAGSAHTVALRKDGSVAAWGKASYGLRDVPSYLTDAVAVAAGGNHTVALRADGAVTAWGNNDYGQCNVPTNRFSAIAVSAGDYHTVALKADGSVIGWGYNYYGQCNAPADLTNAVSVAAGGYHTAALRADGTVAVWGYNDYNQRAVPAGLSNVIAIAAGYAHTEALRADGTVVAWGYNGNGECAVPYGLAQAASSAAGGYNTAVRFDEVTPLRATPPSGRCIPSGSGALTVRLSAALEGGTIRYTLNGTEPTADADAYTGSLAFASTTTLKARLFRGTEPAGAVLTSTYTKQVAAPLFSPATTEQFIPAGGTLPVTLSCPDAEAVIRYTLDGSEPTETSEVCTTAVGLTQTVTLKARAFKTGMLPSATTTARYAVRGEVLAWGYNGNGQCAVPSDLTNAAAIIAGQQHSVALRSGGTVTAWGYNGYGQCNAPAGLSNAVAVAAGAYHTVALRADGTVTAWGYNGYGQCGVPPGLADAVALAAGENHTVALRAGGTVAAWGYNGYGQCVVPPGLSNAVAIAAGAYHTVALKADGTVLAWGYDGNGQCSVPAGLSNAVAIAAGAYHTVALKADGTVLAWGYDYYGQCAVPEGLADVIAIAAGANHTLALRADGTVVGWGLNEYGQRTVQAGLARVSAIAGGGSHTLVQFGFPSPVSATPPSGRWIPPGAGALLVRLSAALGGGTIRYTLNGSEPTAADNAYTGSLAFASTTTLKARLFLGTEPVGDTFTATYTKQVSAPLFSPISSEQFVPAGGTLSVALTCPDADVTIRYTLDGSEPAETSAAYTTALGLTHTVTLKARAFKAGLMPSATSAALYAVRGEVLAWGYNGNGQCAVPSDLTNAAAFAAGESHSVALRSDGTVTAWGYNGHGQCAAQADLTNAVAVAAGTYHTVALKSDGTVTAWGYDAYGQVNVPEGLLDVVAIAAGTYNSVALKADGSVLVWGSNGHGQCDPQPGLSNAVAIAAGAYHLAALRAEGSVTAWGYNGYGQCDLPPGLSNVVAVTAGEGHTVALKADGTIVAWGHNDYGQCAVPEGLTEVVAIAAGARHTVALKADGTVVAWGYNDYGQCAVPTGGARVSAISGGGNHTLVQFGLPSPVSFTPPTGMLVPGSGYPFPVRVLGVTWGGTFRYTLDGSEPTASSPAYAEPVMLGDAATVRAALFTNDVQVGASASADYPLLPGGVVFCTVSTAATPPEAGTASGGGIVRKNGAMTVTALVTDASKYVFGRWLRNGIPVSTLPVYRFTVTANSTLTAVFDLATYTVSATVEPNGLGWVYGTGWWSYGVTNTLTAYPVGGCRFLDWRSAVTDEQLGTNTTYTLAVTNNLTVKARFEEIVTSHTVTTRTEPVGLAAIAGAGSYTNGQLSALAAPPAITNDTLRYVFQHFRLNNGWTTSANPWNWRLTRTDPADADICAVYVAQPLSPKVRQIYRSLNTPVPLTDNLQTMVVFDRQMNLSVRPTVTVSNLTGTVSRTLPATGAWTSWYVSGDTYQCPPFGFARGEDGEYVLAVAGAIDTYGGIVAPTNAWSFTVDATPPSVPTLRLTASNETSFTVGWADYAPPPDLNGFRVYVSEASFTNRAALSPRNYLWSGTRSYTLHGIQLDTTYWVAVVPEDQAGNMETAVTPIAVRIPRAIPPPVSFTVTATGADSARLDWPTYAGDSLGFAEFRIYRDTSPFNTVSNRAPLVTVAKQLRSQTVSGLDRTVTNWFSVVGFNARGESIDQVVSLPWSDPYQGVITNNMTIGSDGTVTEILQPLIVRQGAVLTVPAGATLAFHPGAGVTVENGALRADGTALKPIRFTSSLTNAPAAGDWNGVTLLAQAGGSLLRHVWLEYGRGLTIAGCAPTVDACSAHYNAPVGISVLAGGTLVTRDALLLYNAAAVRCMTGATGTLSRSILRNNVTNALAEAGASLTATNVWWGTAELATIQSGLGGTVACEPFLASEPVLTPAADAADGNRSVGVPSLVLALAGRVAEAVQISEDSLFAGAFYDAFEPRKTVALSAGGGAKTLYIRFRNAAGQVSDTVTVPVTYVTGGPQITACNLAEGAVLTRPFVLTASAWSGLGVATLRVLADDVVIASTNTASLSARWDIRSLAPGTHRIRVEAVDTRDNLGTRAFNVTANIQPPPSPVLTAPADGLLTTNLEIIASGTAEPYETVSLRRGGTVVRQAAVGANGAFSASVPLVEGENVLVATLTDAFGNGRSNERRVTRDSGAPSALTLEAPVYKPGTGLQLKWLFPAEGEKPVSVALLRSEAPFAAAEEATWQGVWTTDNPFSAVPPGDGRWYFAAIGRDTADNRSLLSNMITNDYDGTAPSFAVTFDKASPCGTGLLRIEIVSSETLTNLPTVTVQPPAASGPTMLTVSNTAPNRYACVYNVQSAAGSGVLSVKVSGTDLMGNRATAVAPSGTAMVLDTRPPSGFLTTTPSGLIQVTNPVPLIVSLVLDEVPSAAPVLRFLPPESAQLTVALTGGGTNWNGQVELLPSMGSGIGHFTLSVSDTLGNAGTQLGGGTSVELFNTALPAPPARVIDLRASTDQAGGRIRLAWLAVADAESYALYRQAGPVGTTPDLLIAEELVAATYEDLPAEDGFYRYAVVSTRRGAVAQPSPEALGLSDRTPPPTPQNLTAALSSSGVRVEWEYSVSGEQPEYFRVYRNGTLLRDRVSAATRFLLDNPASGTWSYTVSSVDRNANEALSNGASIDMTLPGVVRTDVVVGQDLVPRITWQTRAEHSGVNLYRNGVKLNAEPLSGNSFSDSHLAGAGVTRYEVRGVSASGSESAARQLPVYHLAYAFAVNPEVSGSALLRYFDRCVLTISNRTTGAAFELAQLDVTRLIAGSGSLTRTERATQSADAGGATDVGVTFPCATAPGEQSWTATVVQSLDDSSASVRYEAGFQGGTPSLALSQLEIIVENQPVAGAACVPRARIFNRSQVPIELVMWRNGQPGDVTVRVLDARETEVNRTDVMMPKSSLIPTPDNLRGYLRIPAKGSTLMVLPETIVPEALGEEDSAFIEVRANNIYARCGEAGEEISGPLLGRLTITPRPTAYTAFGVPERAVYLAGETLVITGYAFDRVTGARSTNVAVNVGIALDGTAWYLEAQSDEQGNFRAEWPIIEGLSGLCQVWASHPLVKDHLNHGQTAIYQAYFRPQEGSVRMAANDSLTIRLNVYNPGSFTFTNLTSAFTAWQVSGGVTNDLPMNIVSGAVSQIQSLVLPPKQQVPVTLTLLATEEAMPSFSCRFEIVTPEGLRIPFDAAVSVTTPLPLITVATPASGYVDMSLDRGKVRSADVELRNDGFKALLGVKMTAPTIPWMQVALTPGTDGTFALPDLAPGQRYTFQVLYAPDDAAEMKYYSDALSITGTNTVTVKTLNLYAKVTSELRGRLAFHVENSLGQVVPDASLRVRSALDGTERTGFKTDENGEVEIPDLMEGRWHWQVSASGHATQAGTSQVEADVTTEVAPVLTRELVTVTFTVVPVPFTDRYEIKIEQTFSTYVPAPVLVVDPVHVDLGTVDGPFEYNFIATAKNYGLIKLTEFTVRGMQATWGSLVPAISYLPVLAPMQQIEIPFTATYLGEEEGSEEAAGAPAPMAAAGGFTLNDAAPQFNPCTDDFMKSVKALMGYLNGRYGSQSGTSMQQQERALDLLWKVANNKRVPIPIGKMVQMYQAIYCIAEMLGVSSGDSGKGGGGGGGDSGGGGYGGGSGGCFAAGTQVLMGDGSSRAVENVRPGDTVRTGPRKADVARVDRTYCRANVAIRELTLESGVALRTTAEHRIWVDSRGWSLANDIRAGDRVACTNDTTAVVTAVAATDPAETVYTFELREDIAFYAQGVLVQHLCGQQFPHLTPTHGTPNLKIGGAQ
jgi:alpha-tubulin suppressor-like RCC1 family protein